MILTFHRVLSCALVCLSIAGGARAQSTIPEMPRLWFPKSPPAQPAPCEGKACPAPGGGQSTGPAG